MLVVRRAIWITIAICLLALIGCSTKSKPLAVESMIPAEHSENEAIATAQAPRTQEQIRSQMVPLFPENGALSGWQRTGKLAFFDESDLFEYINGAAEAFIAYGFKLCGTTEYSPREISGSEDGFILVDVYDMGSAINAFGMYTSELYDESETADIGAQGYIEPPALNFWKGPYYVKITGSKVAESITSANIELAKYIIQNIPGESKKPGMLSLLPERNLVPGSERYILSNILGYSFLKNGVMASYQIGGEEKTLIIMEYKSSDEAKDQFAQFADYEGKSGEGMTKMTDPGEEGFVVNDKYYGRLMVARQGRYLVAATSIADEIAARTLIKEAVGIIDRL